MPHQIASFKVDQNAILANVLDARLALPVGHEAFSPIIGQAEQLVAFANGHASKLRDEEVRPYLLQEFGTRMFRAGAATHGAAVDYQRAHLEREADFRKPAGSIDRKHDPERRARFHGLKSTTAMQMLATADLADLGALVADGNVAALPADVFAEAERLFLEANIVEKQGLEARFAAKPSLSDPLPVGSDLEAARRQAAVILKGHEAGVEVIAVHRRALQDYAGFLAGVFGITADAAFTRMVQA